MLRGAATREYFVVARSFDAPLVPDISREFVRAHSPAEALTQYAAGYKHPLGLYSAIAYKDANAEAKSKPGLAMWYSNRALARVKHHLLPQGVNAKIGGIVSDPDKQDFVK